jgi:cytochrome c-type biogenesis protein
LTLTQALIATRSTQQFAGRRRKHTHLPAWQDVVYNAQSLAGNLAQNNMEEGMTAIPVMYGAGLLTSCSPCVWGILPLTVSYISQAAGSRDDQDTTWPTLAFAAGLASVFCTLGVVAAQVGGVLGSEDGFPWLALISNLICLVMGLRLLELINLPVFNISGWGMTKPNSDSVVLLDASGKILTSKEVKQGLWQTFLLGGSSALVASPCATPVLSSILAYVAAAQNTVLGILFLLAYTAGYATPLLWIAATGGQALVNLKKQTGTGILASLAPWVSPSTAGVLLYYGTTGLLFALFGDPSVIALYPVLE